MIGVRDGYEAKSQRKNQHIPANPWKRTLEFLLPDQEPGITSSNYLCKGISHHGCKGMDTLKSVSPKVTSEAVTLFHHRDTTEVPLLMRIPYILGKRKEKERKNTDTIFSPSLPLAKTFLLLIAGSSSHPLPFPFQSRPRSPPTSEIS